MNSKFFPSGRAGGWYMISEMTSPVRRLDGPIGSLTAAGVWAGARNIAATHSPANRDDENVCRVTSRTGFCERIRFSQSLHSEQLQLFSPANSTSRAFGGRFVTPPPERPSSLTKPLRRTGGTPVPCGRQWTAIGADLGIDAPLCPLVGGGSVKVRPAS